MNTISCYIKQTIALLITLVLLGSVPLSAAAQDYPNRPIRMVVGFPPGGVTDAGARVFAKILGEKIGQTIIVENKGGVGGVLATTYVSRAEPDGHTILYATSGPLVVADKLVDTISYDTNKDFTPIIGLAKIPMILVVNSKSGFQTLEDIIDYSKKNPGKLSYASSGMGTAPNLAVEMIKHNADIDILHVPYKGLAEALMDLLAGRIDMIFDYKITVESYLQSGEVNPIAVSSAARTAGLPNVPTVSESGFPDAVLVPWVGVLAPAGMPEDVTDRLTQAAQEAATDPEMLAFLKSHDQEYFGDTRQDFAEFIKTDRVKWAELFELAGGQSN